MGGGAPKNRRLKTQNVSPGPSLIGVFHSRNCCAVNDSSCAASLWQGDYQVRVVSEAPKMIL